MPRFPCPKTIMRRGESGTAVRIDLSRRMDMKWLTEWKGERIICCHTEKRKDYKNHISGLRGAACVLIMLGHFLGLYKYAQQFVPRFRLMDSILASRFSFLLNEE